MTKVSKKTTAANRRSPAKTRNANGRGTRRATPARSRKVNKPETTASKSETILAHLNKPGGASIAELMTATGWQAHSVRGYLSGTVKKKLGLELVTEKEAGADRTYRIEGAAGN